MNKRTNLQALENESAIDDSNQENIREQLQKKAAIKNMQNRGKQKQKSTKSNQLNNNSQWTQSNDYESLYSTPEQDSDTNFDVNSYQEEFDSNDTQDLAGKANKLKNYHSTDIKKQAESDPNIEVQDITQSQAQLDSTKFQDLDDQDQDLESFVVKPDQKPQKDEEDIQQFQPLLDRQEQLEQRKSAMLKLIDEGFESLTLDKLRTLFPFKIDDFQAESIDVLLKNKSVIVCAPTGAGKTVIAEAGATIALSKGQKMIYTTPLKALSCQKYLDFKELLGMNMVGLQTGDISINAGADITVMTTEILRNIMYQNTPSEILGGLSIADYRLQNMGMIVLDEVHYMGDRDRGFVWEEIIINSPKELQLLCMSATIKQPQYLSNWVDKVHGACELIRTNFRPVPLQWFYAYASKGDGFVEELIDKETLKGERGRNYLQLNETLQDIDGIHVEPRKRIYKRYEKIFDQDVIRQKWKELQEEEEMRGLPMSPSYEKLLGTLQKKDMLPALVFIFSRKGCDFAVQETAKLSLAFTTPRESLIIEQIIKDHAKDSPGLAQDVQTMTALKKGIAAHHAGILPAMKFLVERLFKQGLIKVVFATETLAAGINMPARTTVISRLDRFTGDKMQELYYNQLLQMAGRAGRRGYDNYGFTVVTQNLNEVTTDKAISILNKGPESLDSHFLSGYGLVLNLLSDRTLSEAKEFVSLTYGYHISSKAAEVQNAKLIESKNRNLGTIQQLEQELQETREMYQNMGNAEGPTDNETLNKQRRLENLKKITQTYNNQIQMNFKLLNKNWELFMSVVDLLIDVEAIIIHEDETVETNLVGQIARDLKCTNELWFALALMHPTLPQLSGSELAGLIGALLTPTYLNKETINLKQKPSEKVLNLIDELKPVRQAINNLQTQYGINFSTEVDTRVVGIIEAWASGTQWPSIKKMSDMDDGDVVKLIVSTVDFLRQVSHTEGIHNHVRNMAADMASAMQRPPIVDEGYLALLEDKELLSAGRIKDLQQLAQKQEKLNENNKKQQRQMEMIKNKQDEKAILERGQLQTQA